MPARYIVGDVLEQLRKLDDNSVDLVFSSPPFLALRSYLPADHPDKAKEIGSEPTPGDFIDTLLDVVEECARVLAPHGSLCFELGDTYSGSGGGGGDYLPGGLREDQPGFGGSAERQREGNAAHWRAKNAQRSAWPLDKSLCLIPEIFRFALAYGRNPFNGRTTEPWRVRNVVRWHRPNPPVGALGDKFRPSTSDVVVACKSAKRYFDLDAVRTAHADPGDANRSRIGRRNEVRAQVGLSSLSQGGISNPAGAPPLDTWIIPTAPYKGSHYATFPPALVIKPVLSMCPERVCVVCGEPSRRMTETDGYVDKNGREVKAHLWSGDRMRGAHASKTQDPSGTTRVVNTLGWTDCECPRHSADGGPWDKWRPGVVLDPFAGSGTTLAVATGHGRDAIGIDLDEANAYLAVERCGMFLTVETPKGAECPEDAA